MTVLDTLKDIATEVETAIENEALDVETFFVSGAQYAAKNIKPELVKIAADTMAAAEQALSTGTGAEKYAFAFSNAVAAAEKDGIEFIEADYDSAVQAVIQQRNIRLAAASTSTDTSTSTSTSSDTAETQSASSTGA